MSICKRGTEVSGDGYNVCRADQGAWTKSAPGGEEPSLASDFAIQGNATRSPKGSLRINLNKVYNVSGNKS